MFRDADTLFLHFGLFYPLKPSDLTWIPDELATVYNYLRTELCEDIPYGLLNDILSQNESNLKKVADFRGLYLEAPKELDNNRGMYGYLRS